MMSSRKTLKRLSKDTQVTARVPTAVKTALDRLARKNGMSRAAFVEHLIRREVEREGMRITVEDEDESDLEAA
jgi:predicted transcriptional regulator